jgi:hypothetical protein
MNHTLCYPLSTSDDSVYLAVSAEQWPGTHSGYWWLTYRLTADGLIEVARLKRSACESLFGRSMADVAKLSFGSNFDGFLSWLFLWDGSQWLPMQVSNPKSVFDYAD